jgi:hypothetical protein
MFGRVQLVKQYFSCVQVCAAPVPPHMLAARFTVCSTMLSMCNTVVNETHACIAGNRFSFAHTLQCTDAQVRQSTP